ncbi:uncharacterized [Tachysurus ichikawai]
MIPWRRWRQEYSPGVLKLYSPLQLTGSLPHRSLYVSPSLLEVWVATLGFLRKRLLMGRFYPLTPQQIRKGTPTHL